MPDQRSDLERRLDALIGPPLYYCAACLRAVKVEPRVDAEPLVTRPCGPDCGEGIIAPRKAIAAGEGGLNWQDRTRVTWWKVAAALTGRCV